MQWRVVRLVMMVLGATVAASANANDWGDLAVVSGTLGNNANRLCLGVPASMRPADIGCPTYAPFVTTAGRVGIGTATPTATLQVSGSFIVSTSAQSATPSLYVGTDGRVGLGTLNPDAALHVSRSAAYGLLSVGSSAEAAVLRRSLANSSGPLLIFQKDRGTVDAPAILQNGDVLGGVTFHGYDGSAFSAGVNILGFVDGAPSSGDMPGGVRFNTRPAGGATPLERMRISASGNVGISTLTPFAKLDVVGTISASDAIQVGSSALTCGAGIPGAMRYSSGNMQFCNGSAWTTLGSAGAATAASSTGAIQFNSANALAGDTDNLFWDDANNRLGVGSSSPPATVSINRAANIGGGVTLANAALVISDSTTSTALYFDGNEMVGTQSLNFFSDSITRFTTSGTERVRILQSGNVGIGTTTPSATLMVSGSAIITSNTEVSGTLKVAGTGSEACNAGTYGTIRYNAAIEAFQMCRP